MPTLPPAQAQYLSDVNTPWKMRLFLLKNLPSMAFWGGRVDEATTEHCVASLPYGWRSQNPFSSIYFAAQSGVAELSTGLLVTSSMKAHDRKIAMYVIDFRAQFTKKATERIYYRCDQGLEIQATVDRSVASGQAQTIECVSVGRTAGGLEVGRAYITWSIKAK
ncbi:DUF4442 domain-containing protein [Lewinellaceae bacterium SD302]|nr:DUF4442 domain-containing protein [Lewinellaceae bacterium SD302]